MLVCVRHHFGKLHFALASEPKGQLLFINGKTEDEVARSLERVLLTMRITTSEPKVPHTMLFLFAAVLHCTVEILETYVNGNGTSFTLYLLLVF